MASWPTTLSLSHDGTRRNPREVGALEYRGDAVGYVRGTIEFDEQTTDGVRKAIGDLSNQLGADKIKGFVIDRVTTPGVWSIRRSRYRMHSSIRARSSPCAAAMPRRPSASTPAREIYKRQAAHRARRWWHGVGLGDRRRRAAGPAAGDARRHAHLRRGLGPNYLAARTRQGRTAVDHGAVSHAIWPFDPG